MADKDIRYSVTAEDRFARTFANLKRDIAASKDQLGGLQEKAAMASRALAIVSFGTAAGAGGFALAVKQLAHDLDELNDAADATGSTVENLSALEDIARRNGAGLDLATTAVMRLNVALKEGTPNSPIALAIKRIGLDAAELRKLDPSEALLRLTVAMATYADDGNKARLVSELYGKSLKEAAPFLKDVAEAGTLNAKVTTEQAQAAERFNKELFAFNTNASNAARALVSELIPSVNKTVQVFRDGFKEGKGFFEIMRNEQLKILGVDVEAARIKAITSELDGLNARLEKGNMLSQLRQSLEEKRVVLQRELFSLQGKQEVRATSAAVVPEPPKPSVGDLTGKGQKAQVTEAQRFLEQLEKQIAAEDKLSNYEKLLLDIEQKRIEGLNPAIEERLKKTARFLDLLKQVNDEHEREAGFLKLIADKDQKGINDALSLMENTPTGQRDNIERQTGQILRVSRANPGDENVQRRASEALANLRKQMDELNKPAEAARSEFDKLADTIEKGMDRATSAVLDFAVEGKGSIGGVFDAFKRDILREIIEEPLRDSMKNAVKIIRGELQKVGEGGNPLEGIMKWFQGIGSGGSGGSTDWFGTLINFFGGSTGRAGGGSVKAGQLVRWNENGREWFVPGSDGTVVNPGQQRAMAAGAASPAAINTNIVVNGDVSPQTVRMLEVAIERNNAKLMRSMRTGGAFSG